MNTYTKYSCVQFAIDAEKEDEEGSLKLQKWMEYCLVQVKVLISVEDAVEGVNTKLNYGERPAKRTLQGMQGEYFGGKGSDSDRFF